jgi:hypothetical protein
MSNFFTHSVYPSGILRTVYFEVKRSLSPVIRVSVFGILFIWSIEGNEFHSKDPNKRKVKFTLEHTTKAQKGNTGIALLFL